MSATVKVKLYRLELVAEGEHETMEDAERWATQDGLRETSQPSGITAFLGAEQLKLLVYQDKGRPPHLNKHGYRWFWRSKHG